MYPGSLSEEPALSADLRDFFLALMPTAFQSEARVEYPEHASFSFVTVREMALDKGLDLNDGSGSLTSDGVSIPCLLAAPSSGEFAGQVLPYPLCVVLPEDN